MSVRTGRKSVNVGAAEWEAMSTEEREAWVRANCFDCQHASGSCKMGVAGDPATVVDSSNGSVVGLEGLRVVDGSLLPLTVRGNIHLTVLMLAEKLADAIKEAYAVAEQAEQEAEAPRGRL